VWVSLKDLLGKLMQHMQLLKIKATREKWTKGDKKCRRDALLKRIAHVVLEWQIDETKMSQNKKKVIINLIAIHVKEMHAKHYL
jgi:hypothetical protein